MYKTIGITLLAAASIFGAVAAAYAFGRKRTGSSFRELYEDNASDSDDCYVLHIPIPKKNNLVIRSFEPDWEGGEG